MAEKEAKLRFLGIHKLAKELKEVYDYETVATELGVDVKDLFKWEKEFRKLEQSQNVQGLLDVDESIVEQIATDVIEMASELNLEPRVEVIAGKITVIESESPSNKETELATTEKQALLESFRCKVNGLQVLNTEVQGTAGLLLTKIIARASKEDLDIKELSQLVSSLTSIQNAFFNKPVTQVMVNTGGGGDSLLGAFQARMKP